jgi:SAM-dependent methyltransferase
MDYTKSYTNLNSFNSTKDAIKVKEMFIKLGVLLNQKQDRSHVKGHVLDVGCASGALINYLQTVLPHHKFTGVDTSQEFLEVAQNINPDATWINANALKLPENLHNAFDVSLSLGVIGIFNEEESIRMLKELVRTIKCIGVVYVFSHFNDHNVDMLVNHRVRQLDGEGKWETGFNNFSKNTVSNWLDKIDGVEECRFIDFELPFGIKQDKINPSRSWSFEDKQGKLLFTNGLNLLLKYSILEILVDKK